MAYALLIDDDEGIRRSLARAAELSGLALDTAASWDEGLAAVQVYAPELVIADYNLPGSRHGLKLLMEIRRLSPSVRLLLLSAYIGENDVADIERLGLVDRAIPKTGAANTTDELLAEIVEAEKRSQQDTDWAAYAVASREAKAVDQSDLDTLDERLKRSGGLSYS